MILGLIGIILITYPKKKKGNNKTKTNKKKEGFK